MISATAAFTLDLAEIVEEAFERNGAELRSGYDLQTARRSLNLLLTEWANRGLNLWTLDAGIVDLTAGVATYTLPDDTIDLVEYVLRRNHGEAATQIDYTLSRISVSTYSTIPNKLTRGRPIQIYVDRQQASPVITLWPVPNDNGFKLALWRLKRMADATAGDGTQDVPYRFLPALIAGLAYYLSMKIPGALERMPLLKAQYDEAWQTASDEDRDKSTSRFVPRAFRIR